MDAPVSTEERDRLSRTFLGAAFSCVSCGRTGVLPPATAWTRVADDAEGVPVPPKAANA